jgi:NitT/TauT family transport system substrate-binding protein
MFVMMKRKWYFTGLIMAIIALVISGCGLAQDLGDSQADEPIALTPTRLTMGYIPNIQFAPVYVSMEKGYFNQAGFDVTLEYGNEADAVALVGAGDQTFCVASGEQVLLARAQGLPVTYVAAWYQDYPVGVVSLAEAGIQNPGDLAGVDVGIPGLYGASYIGFKALLDAGDLTEEDVSLLPIGFNQVEALVADQSDAVVIYLANEPVVLRHQGYDVNVMRVADYLKLVSNGLVTNEETLESDPEMVRAFVEAFLKGIADTIADPDEAHEISKLYVENLAEADRTLQFEILEESIQLWRADRLGFSDPTGWENMHEVLFNMGLLTETLDLEGAFTNDLLP